MTKSEKIDFLKSWIDDMDECSMGSLIDEYIGSPSQDIDDQESKTQTKKRTREDFEKYVREFIRAEMPPILPEDEQGRVWVKALGSGVSLNLIQYIADVLEEFQDDKANV